MYVIDGDRYVTMLTYVRIEVFCSKILLYQDIFKDFVRCPENHQFGQKRDFGKIEQRL